MPIIVYYRKPYSYFNIFDSFNRQFYFNNPPRTYILACIGLTICIISVKDFDTGIIVTYTAFFVLSGGILEYLKLKQEKIKTADEKIDELNIQNEELSNSIRDLEMYNESIEDLIILKERNRISREIHDSVGHGLSTIIIQFNALYEMTNINVQFTFSKNIWALNDEQNHTIYKSVQEFLSNSAKYGAATKITIHFSYTENSLIITMKDNGKGCTEIKKGIGLKAIDERVRETNGSVHYESLPRIKGFFMQIIFFKNNITRSYSAKNNIS